MSESPSEQPTRPPGIYGLFGGAVALGVGAFMPWIKATAPLVGTLSKSGVDNGGDGLLILVAAVVVLVLALLSAQPAHGAKAWPPFVALCVAAGAGVVLVADASDISSKFKDAHAASDMIATQYGAGLYLCGLGAVAVVVGAVMLLTTKHVEPDFRTLDLDDEAAVARARAAVHAESSERGRVCPNGHDNRPGARFCDTCGSSVLESF